MNIPLYFTPFTNFYFFIFLNRYQSKTIDFYGIIYLLVFLSLARFFTLNSPGLLCRYIRGEEYPLAIK